MQAENVWVLPKISFYSKNSGVKVENVWVLPKTLDKEINKCFEKYFFDVQKKNQGGLQAENVWVLLSFDDISTERGCV